MDLIQILQKTITGTPEEIAQTSHFLNQQQGNPQYISCLLQIISNAELQEILRLAAAIQLKNQVRNNYELSLDFSTICTLIVISPIRVQLQLQVILFAFVKKRIEQGQIEQIISICAEFIQKDANHALVSVLILRFLIKLNCIGNYIGAIAQFFLPITTLVLASLNSENVSQFSLFIHTSLHMASKFFEKLDKGTPLPAIENWVEIITQIINQPAYQSPPFLDKDAIKLACVLYDSLPPQINASLLLSIATHSITGAAFKTTAMSFKFLKPALSSNELWPLIEHHQFDLVGGLFFLTFTLSQQDLLDIKDNLYDFISSTQISAFDFRTPRNGAVTSFLTAVPCHPTLAQCAVKIVLCELESFRESGDIGRAYGALQFAGLALQKAPEPFAQKTAHIIYDTAFSMLQINNFIYTAGFFQFIGLKADAFNDVNVLFKCFEAIINPPSTQPQPQPQPPVQGQLPGQPIIGGYVEDPARDLVQYFASYAAASLFANFKKDQELCASIRHQLNSNGAIKPLLSNVLRICKLYATDQSAATIRTFTDFFVENIAPVAMEYVKELFSIFLQYVRDPHHYARISITSCQVQIPRVCKVIRMQRNDVPPAFFSEALFRIEEVALQCDPQILEEVLDLMACFAECMTEISEPFINVPTVLLNVIKRAECGEQNGDLVNAAMMSDELHPISFINVIKAIIKINPGVVTSTPQMFLPIVEIAKHFLAKFNTESSDCEGSVPLFQLIFIKLKQFPSVADVAVLFLQLIDQLSPTFIADIVAALVYFNPVLTLHNERNLERWMAAHDTAFLMGALSVLQCWNSLPNEVVSRKQQIVAKIAENLAILNDHVQKDECDEDPDIFDVPLILQTFANIKFQ